MGKAPEIEIDGTGRRVALVVARFNEEATIALATGARAALLAAGVREDDIVQVEVPGAFELAPTCRQVLSTEPNDLDAIVALGAVVRGETPHFEYLSNAVTHALQTFANEINIPLVFGVLTTDTLEQARERADRDRGDKGGEASRAALVQCELYDRLRDHRDASIRGFRIS